jgi:hypothetical protein
VLICYTKEKKKEQRLVQKGLDLLQRWDELCRNSDAGETSGHAMAATDDDEYSDYDGAQDARREPEIICRHLDHVNSFGLSKTTLRLR